MRQIIRNSMLVAIALLSVGAAVQAADTKYGAGVTIATATPIKDLYASPDKFVGKTVRVDGVVTAVCTEMGCWLAIGATDNPDQAVRFQAEHDGKIVFPISMKGKPASAEGVFVKIAAGDHEAKEAAGEHAHAQPKAADFGSKYQFQVTGAVAP
ncbi:MAG TPA: DUF4920 domain-containing protein [Vicinamibacterales bacterium]